MNEQSHDHGSHPVQPVQWAPPSTPPDPEPLAADTASSHRGHGLMMLVCCIPMIVIAIVLVVTGVAGTGAIVWALLCTAMMAAMMIAMPGHRH